MPVGFPRFCGGLAGYFGYDTIRYIESKLADFDHPDEIGMPDILLLLTDGKPHDLDHYEGRAGVEDTRQAVREARRAGLIPFAVSIDTEAGEVLPGLFGSTALVERYAAGFPESLNGAPLFLPTRQNALRGRIDRWMEVVGIRPRIIGEFQDSALLTTFGRAGLGFFPAPLALAAQVASQLDAVPLGEMAGVSEQIYAISNERRIRHPAIEVLCAAAPQGSPGHGV